MNCSKCGAPIEDGAIFCSECGSPVSDAPAAEAPAAPVAPAPAPAAPVTPAPAAPTAPVPPVAPAAPVQQVPYPNQQQPYPGQPYPGQPMYQQNPYGNMAPAQPQPQGPTFGQKLSDASQKALQAVSNSQIVNGTVDIVKLSFMKPASAASSTIASANFLPGIIMIAIQLLIVIICDCIKYPGIPMDAFGFGAKLGYGCLHALSYVILYLAVAGGIMLRKDPDKKITFQSALSAIGTQTIYSTILILVTFIFGTFSMSVSGLASGLILIVFVGLCSRVIFNNVIGDDDKKHITSVIVLVVAVLLFSLFMMIAERVLFAELASYMKLLGSLM